MDPESTGSAGYEMVVTVQSENHVKMSTAEGKSGDSGTVISEIANEHNVDNVGTIAQTQSSQSVVVVEVTVVATYDSNTGG